jgi:hypothetical protein
MQSILSWVCSRRWLWVSALSIIGLGCAVAFLLTVVDLSLFAATGLFALTAASWYLALAIMSAQIIENNADIESRGHTAREEASGRGIILEGA